MAQKTVLSIGMIFKNEARCLERCLKSLAPLRAALPCELVMADTGSEDGSREIAEKYADILFDFPWIDDFAAARNAVMERCSGAWYLSIDADEWLDKDCSDLVSFLQSEYSSVIHLCTVIVRNYATWEVDDRYTDLMAVRMARMDWHPHYVSPIHEHWLEPEGRKLANLRKTIFHHDGYVVLNQDGEEGVAKRQRNITLLREQLEKNPEDLRAYSEFLDVGDMETDYMDMLRKAVSLVEERKPAWRTMGPVLLDTAVIVAHQKHLAELEDWIQKADEWFPDSLFVCVDIAFIAFVHYVNQEDFEKARYYGEKYLNSLEEDRAGRLDIQARRNGVLKLGSPSQEHTVRISLSEICRKTKQLEKAWAYLEAVDFPKLDVPNTGKLALALMNLHANSQLDTASLVQKAWEGISSPVPNPARAVKRKKAFCQTALPAFSSANQEKESEKERRHTYTLFLPLAEVCDLGRAAAMLETEDKQELERLLSQIEDWQMLPGQALAKALEQDINFPLRERPLELEDMDILAARLAEETDVLTLLSPGPEEGWQAAAWARGLAMAGVRACKWKDKEDLVLARAFADAERRFVPMCYTQEAIEDLHALPSLHRFGWKCAQAFEALDRGDVTGYTRCLREGLETCESMKPLVEFLTKHTPELKAMQPDPELMDLAGKVHDLLNLYPQDDPAVIAIKQSPVYQRVAHLIEEDTP